MSERPITVSEIWPLLTERGQVEVRAAVAEFKLAALQQQQGVVIPPAPDDLPEG